ncbi:hypothetical protein COH96_10705 [Neisseria meningitidis]|nr:hypothetical protein COH99_11500 [Neisseria meningitidis]RQK04130.1 hypothetical protein COH96_10705 [Neisseria meningitidis]
MEVTRNLKQAKPNELDSHFRGNDGILGFCFWFSVFVGMTGCRFVGMTVQLLRIYPAQSFIHYLATCLTICSLLQNAETFSGCVLGLPVRNLAVGAVVGF